MTEKLTHTVLILLILLAAATPVWSQTARGSHQTLTISGRPGQAPVIQKDGKSYVDIEALARLTNGTLSFNDNQITLTLSPSATSTPIASSATGPAPNSAFSKEFLKAGIEAMSVVREWRTTIVSSIQNGYPVTDDSVAGYSAAAVKNIRLVNVAASTDADRNAFQLLNNELENMKKLSSKVVAAHKDMQNITPEALENDPLNQQILTCARSLVSMAASGQFQDDGACH